MKVEVTTPDYWTSALSPTICNLNQEMWDKDLDPPFLVMFDLLQVNQPLYALAAQSVDGK